jgi:hypothetical protein
MPDFGIFRGFNEKLFGDKLYAGQLPINLGLIGSEDLTLLLLDDYPNAAAAYSLRLLRTAYTGSAIRVRRTVGSPSEKDIGFINNELDVADLQSFCSGTNGFVTTWYDQSGNGRNATQSTAIFQPQIVSGGSVMTKNGKPQIEGGLNKELDVNYAFNGNHWIFGAVSTHSDLMVYLSSQNAEAFMYAIDTTSTAFNLNLTISDQYLNGQSINPSTRLDLYNLFDTSTTQPLKISTISTTINWPDFQFGFWVSNGMLDMSEFIIYPSNQSSNRTGIESNINTYYGIY